MKRMTLALLGLLVVSGVFLWPRGNAQPAQAPDPNAMTPEAFQKWSGHARGLLDGANPNCWVLVTNARGAEGITHDQVSQWSKGLGSTNISIAEGDFCFFCVKGDAVQQIPAWVLLDYLKDKAAAKQSPLRIMVAK
jgi:hypothetical protein